MITREKVRPKKVVLEIGSGHAPAPFKKDGVAISHDVAEYIAGDISEENVEIAQEDLEDLKRERVGDGFEKMRVVQLDARDLKLPDNSVDEVLCNNLVTVIKFPVEMAMDATEKKLLHAESLGKALKEFFRVLKKDGILKISETIDPAAFLQYYGSVANFVDMVSSVSDLEFVSSVGEEQVSSGVDRASLSIIFKK